MTDETAILDRYGVMGHPVSHSKSPVIHTLFAEQTDQHLKYELLDVPRDKLATAVRQFQRSGGRGKGRHAGRHGERDTCRLDAAHLFAHGRPDRQIA